MSPASTSKDWIALARSALGAGLVFTAPTVLWAAWRLDRLGLGADRPQLRAAGLLTLAGALAMLLALLARAHSAAALLQR